MTKDTAIEMCKAIKQYLCSGNPMWNTEAIAEAIDMAIEALKSQPFGKWIRISPSNIYECSECGQNVMTDDIDCYKFCHGCGAKMEKWE